MRLFIVIVAALLLGVSIAHAEPGDPVPGILIGLASSPDGDGPRTGDNIIGNPGIELLAGTTRPTDRTGNVVFSDLPPGRYAVIISDGSRLQGPVRIRISADVATLRAKRERTVDITTRPTTGRFYATEANGQRLMVTIPSTGGRIIVNVTTIFDRWGRQDQSSR